jgi:hypothetical protein
MVAINDKIFSLSCIYSVNKSSKIVLFLVWLILETEFQSWSQRKW